MKKFYILSLLLSNFYNFAQGGFTKVVNATNPITTFTAPDFYKGASWIDFDNDNDLDLFASPNFLFRNDGNDTFVELPNSFDFTPSQTAGGSSWADLNNDGFIDCIIAQSPSRVFLNNGDSTFTNISSQIPNLDDFPAWGCAIGDWNKDAFLDFVFSHAAGFHTPGPFPSKLYLNTSAAVMPEYITGYTLTDETHPYTVPYWSDYDLDGDMDLFVASGPGGTSGPDYCYKNMKIEDGSNTFTPMTSELFATQPQDGQCYNFIDFDNDGDLDLCLTNYAGAPSRFYLNNSGTYTIQTMPFSATAQNLTNDWGDFDNDGDLDVMITNDQRVTKYYKNNGNGTFATAINLGAIGGCGISNGDYDNDGDLDVFINGDNAARALFKNTSGATGNNWITIKCTGTVSNKSAIGTIVKIRATINGVDTWQIREISAQNSFQSQNDLRVHFGIGNATIIQTLIIKYPSGIIETFSNVNPNIFYSNIENSGNLLSINSQLSNTDYSFSIYPNPSKSNIRVDFKSNLIFGEINIEVIDLNGKLIESESQTAENNSLKIDTSSLSNGIYCLKLKGQNFVHYMKFVKE